MYLSGPVSEAQVKAAMIGNSWLSRYVDAVGKQTAAPLAFSVGVGLSILASTCPKGFKATYSGPVSPNIYCLLLGNPASFKSTALRCGVNVLHQACIHRTATAHLNSWFSAETLFRNVHACSTFISAGDDWIVRLGRDYLLKELMASLWDGHKYQRITSIEQTTIYEPQLSVAFTSSPQHVMRYASLADFTSGYLSRFFVLYAQPERVISDPSTLPSADLDNCPDELKLKSSVVPTGPCDGLDSGAQLLWDTWMNKKRSIDYYSTSLVEDAIYATAVRAPLMARKLSLILSWDMWESRSFGDTAGSWRITEEVMASALALTDLHEVSVSALVRSWPSDD